MLDTLFVCVIFSLFAFGSAQECQNCFSCVDKECRLCEEGYALTYQNICVKTNLTNCLIINSAGYCMKCSSVFNLVFQKCQEPSFEFCIKDMEGKCEKCLYGTKMENGKCGGIFNCMEYDQNGFECKTCHKGHYLDKGKCHAIDGCRLTQHNGMCEQCQEQFQMNNFLCIRKQKLIQNCEMYSYEKDCLKCKVGYEYERQKKICQMENKCMLPHPFKANKCMVCFDGYYGEDCKKVSRLCKERRYNLLSGKCLQCQLGYQLNERQGICFDPNCQQIFEETCLRCREPFLRQKNSLCLYDDKNCLFAGFDQCYECKRDYFYDSFDKKCKDEIQYCKVRTDSICEECEQDHILIENKCIRSQDRNCKRYDRKGLCAQCSFRYYQNKQTNRCILVNPLCRTYNILGQCTSCYPSFEIRNKICVLEEVKDQNCKKPNANGCLECYSRYYVGQGGVCKEVNPLCKSYNFDNGDCLSCFPGYALRNKKCIIEISDPFCKILTNNINCEQCIYSFYYSLSTKRCERVNPVCRTYNQINGNCTSCYQGYTLTQGTCLVSGVYANCKKIQNNECVECFSRYYLNEGNCEQVNPLCKEHVNNKCLSCYPGYQLFNFTCIIQKDKEDRNCKVKENDYCLQCFEGFSREDGVCTKRDDQCSEFSQVFNRCFQCFPGYVINQKFQCIDVRSLRTDINCVQYFENQCQACSDGYFLNEQKRCLIINPLCKTHRNGQCLSCYQGYFLQQKQCINPVQQLPQIPNCQQYSKKGSCTSCLTRFYLRNNECLFVSPFCQTYNQTNGLCLSCRSDFFNLQNGKCIQLNSIVKGCVRYEGPFCGQCSSQQGYYLTHERNCYKLDPNCQIHDFALSLCKKCNEGRKLVNNICE